MTPAKPTFNEAIKFWIRLGFISFGGPAGQIAIMHEYLVEKKKWISDRKFLHALNYCMILPGPEAQQLATYIGWLLHGRIGGLAAGILFVLPSMFILLGLSILYVTYGSVPWIYAMFDGLKPAVIAIVILALIKISKKSLLSTFHYGVGIAAFISIFFFNIPFPFIIFGAIVVGAILKTMAPALVKSSRKQDPTGTADEGEYYLNSRSVVPHASFSSKSLFSQIGTAGVLWLIPFLLFFLFSSDAAFWSKLSLFFTQAAFVTFGGAYSVLPYVAQVSVEKLHWLTELQMLDGLALGETTPGPLIMVLAFVGFMAGHNHFGGSWVMGSVGLVSTVFYTFLPCFLFIFAGAPVIENTQDNTNLKQILSLVTAAVVGVVLNLTIYLGQAVLFPSGLYWAALDYISLGWVVVSFVAMYRLNVNMITWIGASAVFGLVRFLLM